MLYVKKKYPKCLLVDAKLRVPTIELTHQNVQHKDKRLYKQSIKTLAHLSVFGDEVYILLSLVSNVLYYRTSHGTTWDVGLVLLIITTM